LAEDDFTFHHLKTDEDIEQNLELMLKVFGPEDGADAIVRRLIDHHPRMTLKNHFVMKHRGRMVASLNLIPEKWSIGGIPLKVAEMGCVGTLAEYRHRGLIRRLVDEYHKHVADHGYDLSVIEGIPYFYRQFGYEYAIPLDENIRISLDQIPDYESKTTIRPFTSEDIPKAMRLLKQTQRKFYVHTIRDKQIWKIQHETSTAGSAKKFEAYAVEKDCKMIAYIRIRNEPKDKSLILKEITETDQPTAQAALRFLKDTGKQRGLETLSAHISHHETFTKHLAAIGAVQSPPYAWQIRVTDYVKMFRKMKSLFEKRLATSTYRHLTEKLNFNFCRYTVQMTVEDGKVADVQRLETNEDRTIGLNPLIFAQLLLGHRSRKELEMTYPDFSIRPSHKHLIDTLFPKLPSYIHVVY